MGPMRESHGALELPRRQSGVGRGHAVAADSVGKWLVMCMPRNALPLRSRSLLVETVMPQSSIPVVS